MLSKKVFWIDVETETLIREEDYRYPLCSFPDKECSDASRICGRLVCDVWDGNHTRCPYLKR